MSKVRIEIEGKVYESKNSGPEDAPCSKCAFAGSPGCGMTNFCVTHVGFYGYFEKSQKTFDEILLENKDVLQRLKMGIVPTVPQDDDSEYIND